MAHSLTVLSWGVIEFWDAYNSSRELDYMLGVLKWGADYILKAHTKPYELYGQVNLTLCRIKP